MSKLPLGLVLRSSVGRKLLVAATGLFLTIFLLVHCYVNFTIFMDNPERTFNRAANFMATNLFVRLSEFGLFFMFIVHIYQSLFLHFSNKRKRKVAYAVKPGNQTSSWYSRSMGLFGSLILIFLIIHLAHFWVPGRILHSLSEVNYSGEDGEVIHNMYALMHEIFQNFWVVLIYIVGCVALAWHLYHGFQGAFRTFGLTHQTYLSWAKLLGGFYALIICLLFILMPLSMYFDFYPRLTLG